MLEIMAGPPSREKIYALEREIAKLPQLDLQAKHYFSPGLYARELFIPAGSVITGKLHKTAHLNICCGDVTVWTEIGMLRLTGHNTIPSMPGAKRVMYAHADTYWTCLHVTTETDIEKLEAELVENEEIGLNKTGAIWHITT